jgi:uncharacterized protein involved in exopolysaccharide biosynthesis
VRFPGESVQTSGAPGSESSLPNLETRRVALSQAASAPPEAPLLLPEPGVLEEHTTQAWHVPESPASQRSQTTTTNRSWRDRLVLDTLRLMIQHKVVVVLLVFLTTLSGGASTFLTPPFYIARASIFPPPSDNPLGSFGMAGVAGMIGSLGLGGGGTTQFHLYQDFVQSRTLISKVLEMSLHDVGFAGTLMQYLEIDEPDAVRKSEIAVESIRMRLQFEADKQTGIVAIRFTDNSPKIAAAVVNSVIEKLDRFDADTAVRRARDRREFIEIRLNEASETLSQVEGKFEAFRQQNMRIGNAPNLVLEQARLRRDVEFEQQIYLTLRKEYELARIDEERSVPVVNVLDLAVPPTVPAGPSLLRNIATGGFLGVMLVLGMFVLMALQPKRLLRQWGLAISPARS